jgi:hypothetical protein
VPAPDGCFPHAAPAVFAERHVRDPKDGTLRSGTSPQAAAAIRNAVIASPRLAGFTSTAAGRRWAARNPTRALAVLNLI